MGYYDEVAADNPIAFWKLDEAAPSGAGSLNDSASGSLYDATPNGTATWNQAGPLSDGNGRSARLDGSSGYVSGGTSVAAALMASAWTVELWFYAERTNGGTIFAASDGTRHVRVEHYGAILYSSSTPGGNKSSQTVTGNWHHLVITSAGDLYLDGVAQVGTSNSNLNATVQVTVGARNNASDFFGGRVSCVSLYTSVLSSTRVTAHRNAGIARTLPAGRTFYWGFESDVPDVFPAGSDDTPSYDVGSSRTTAQAFAGANSLSLGGGTFRSATFDNLTDQHQWCSPDQGRIQLRWRYTGSAPGTMMLCQITGKDRAGLNDTNDSVQLLVFASGGSVTGGRILYKSSNGTVTTQVDITQACAADTWHEAEIRWRSGSSPYLYVRLNATTATGTSPFGSVVCSAWHHLLIGNDLSGSPTGLWIDEFETFGSYDGVEASNPAILTGFGFFT